jgi:cephalosporin hydroxylase
MEGSSTDPLVVEKVRAAIRPGEVALVLLDANHSKDHVLKELEAYGPLVGVGSCIVVADGIMEEIVEAPGARPEWAWDNPKRAVAEFLARHPGFAPIPPPRLFNEGLADRPVTYWPDGYLRRIR